MWDSNGDISGRHIQQVDSGDMRVSGKIDGESFVSLVSTGGSIVVDGKIDGKSSVSLRAAGTVTIATQSGDKKIAGNSFVSLVSTGSSIVVDGKIEGGSTVILASTLGTIEISGKIDENSNVSLKAAGRVTIGTHGGDEDKKIDGNSQVSVVAGDDITLGSYIHNATADFKSHGGIRISEIDFGARVRQVADGDILVTGKITGNQVDHGPSRVELVSNRGSVRIYGKIEGESKVSLTAKQDVAIGFDAHLGDDDRKIAGNSLVTAIAGGSISVGGGIFNDHTTVDLAAATGITIGTSISGGPNVRLLAAGGQITVTGGISDNATTVTYFPAGALVATISGAQVAAREWAAPDTFSLATDRPGYWWENFPQTFGYVAPGRVIPRTVDDIITAITAFDRHVPVKAVGGGYSFSDVGLPFQMQQEVDKASTQLRGMWQRQDMRTVLEGLKDTQAEPMDLLPQAMGRNLVFSTTYDQAQLRQVTSSGAQLPRAQNEVCLIDTRSLASSLQDEFRDIRVDRGGASPVLFHVEAGITMADLQQLLDHQQPRLAILDSSAGPSGATLAGVLSTATHGATFRWPLLADTVRAVHLVGPGGEQWWIEGDVPVAKQNKLQERYRKIDRDHFIGNGWQGIPGLTSQDVLNAVTVSMGTMGVIYSVVLEVERQFGLRQVVHPTSWHELLGVAGVRVEDLRAGNATANRQVLEVLLDGIRNGTGIAEANNVFAHVRINPFNFDCWVINQEVTPKLPDDANNPSPDYLSALSPAMARRAVNHTALRRVVDFLSWDTNITDLPNDVAQAQRLLAFITGLGDIFGGTLAAISVQAVANQAAANVVPTDRGQQFLGDLVTGAFHALHGTAPGQNSDCTVLPYKFGAIGWPERGTAGRALELALDPTNAFTFLQTVLFDDVLGTFMSELRQPLKPLIGYIAVRVCQPTKTLMGMQQYSPYSVMVEVAGYRSPEANEVMNEIQTKALAFSTAGPKPLLHWGLENDQVTATYLSGTPLGQPYKGSLTRLTAFTAIRNYLKKGHPPVFDNNFSNRLGL